MYYYSDPCTWCMVPTGKILLYNFFRPLYGTCTCRRVHVRRCLRYTCTKSYMYCTTCTTMVHGTCTVVSFLLYRVCSTTVVKGMLLLQFPLHSFQWFLPVYIFRTVFLYIWKENIFVTQDPHPTKYHPWH
jgi:hypothetical protein